MMDGSGNINSNLPVLVADDEPEALLCCRVTLQFAGIRDVVLCDDSRQVMELMRSRAFGAVMLDLRMPYRSGEELLIDLRAAFPEVPVIIMTGANDVETAVRCMSSGAFDYMVKPVDESRMLSGVRRALALRELDQEDAHHHARSHSDRLEHPEAFSEFVTASPVMQAAFRYLEMVARTGRPILITGETGVGKEVLARSIHRLSEVPGDFVAVNIAGVDDAVFSDTLFGHARGAYTGADAARGGLIERASGGTLFLDEIGSLSAPSQVKLLRLVQEREYFPIGVDTPRHTDARLVVATNQDLHALQERGEFRRDLFFRLHTHHVHIPPLRERKEDIPLLVEHFLELASRQLGKKKPTPPRELGVLLSTYLFPGNVRELEAMVFEAVSHHKSHVLSLEMFQSYMAGHGCDIETNQAADADGAGQVVIVPERFPKLREATDYIVEEAMRRAKGNQTIAAQLLGMSRTALSKRLKQMAGDKPR